MAFEYRSVHPDFRELFPALESADDIERAWASVGIRFGLQGLAESGVALDAPGYAAMVPHLLRHLHGRYPDMRGLAAESLGWLKARDTEGDLRRLLHSESDSNVQLDIHFALARLGDKASELSIRNWLGHHDKDTRIGAIVHSGNLGIVGALPRLEAYALPDKDYEHRLPAIRAIGQIGRLTRPPTRIRLLWLMKKYASERDNDLAQAAENAVARLRSGR